MESIRLRVKDLDFNRRVIYVRDGKGGKDRVVTLAEELIVPLQRHLQSVRTIHERDLEEGYGRVYPAYALERKYPKAPEEWAWLYAKPIYNALRVAIHFAIRSQLTYSSVAWISELCRNNSATRIFARLKYIYM